MKTVPVRELQKCIKECVDHAQKACVVITRHGRPAAVLVGVEGKDWEQVVKDTAPELAKHIAAKPHRVKSRKAAPAPEKPKHEEEAQPSQFMQTVRRFIPGL
jgi:prevent-host-death family protein